MEMLFCFVLSLLSQWYIPTSEEKPELTEKQPEIKASFKVIPFTNNIAD